MPTVTQNENYTQYIKEYSKEYYDTHAEQKKAARRQYTIDNRERLRTQKKEYSKRIQETNPAQHLLKRIKNSARQRKKQCNLTIEDIIIPTHCPILGIPLVFGTGMATDNSPSVDRIRSNEGYIKGNIIIISHRANTIKNNATVEELYKIAKFYEQLLIT